MYTIDTVPHLRCSQCKFCGSDCKRVDHKTIEFRKHVFSCQAGEWHIPCADFQPAHPEYADFKDWDGMENAFPVYAEAWLPKIPDRIAFNIGGNTGVDYLVPFDLFYRGEMVRDGVLLADRARFLKRDKVSQGVQLYKIAEKVISGINLEDAMQIEQL